VALFSEQFIQHVAQATDIVEVVAQYVALKKRGKEFVGLCPFHDDKRPSMYVSPAKQIFKCFACGAGGSVYQFLMRHERMSFPEVVRTLAERANIPLPRDTEAAPVPQGLSRNELVALSTFAAQFFRDQLGGDAGKGALDYALQRGLSEESIRRFGIGYAPDSWDALLGAARVKGFTEEQIVAAGLAIQKETGGLYDRFRNRLMFPIIDPGGRVIAFGGRALSEQDRAKYLNSPETSLFDKSGQLYGVNWARKGFDASGQAVVVEGYLDVLIPHQAGVDNVVATLGTALTERHVRLLGRYVGEVVLVFDADVAGAAATERALEVFLAQQVNVRVATIPAGKDPCDYCLAEGADAFRTLIAEAPDALQYVWERRLEQYKAAGSDLAGRRRAIEDFLRLVATSGAYGAIDEVRRGQLAQHIGHILNVAPEDLQQRMRALARRARAAAPADVPQASRASERTDLDPAERQLIEVLLNRPDLFDHAAERLDPRDFTSADLQAIATRAWALAQDGTLTLEGLMNSQEMSPYASLLADLAFAGEQRGNYEPTLAGAVEHILRRRDRSEVQQLKSGDLSDEKLRQLSQRLGDTDLRKHPKTR